MSEYLFQHLRLMPDGLNLKLMACLAWPSFWWLELPSVEVQYCWDLAVRMLVSFYGCYNALGKHSRQGVIISREGNG